MPVARVPDESIPVEHTLPPLDGDVVEISLFLPGWQASCLERKASSLGLTAGQMMRRLLGRFLEEV
jgi:hypothetical protein